MAKSKPKRAKNWNDNIPDTRGWNPRHVGNRIAVSFTTRCKQIRERIIQGTIHERESNIDNYDSGGGVEDIVRRELSLLCPKRYLVTAATIDDRKGQTAGDYEIVITDDFWVPILKAGAVPSSRKVHLPIEAVYGVVEVKQSIDFNILDQAMKKVVACHRLYRPSTPASRILENIDLSLMFKVGKDEYKALPVEDHPNPLFSAILAVNIKPGIAIEDLMMRFATVSRQLKRSEVIQILCVLDAGCIHWAWISDSGPITCLFRGDELERRIYPMFTTLESGREPFYPFAAILLKNLFMSTLPLHELPMVYGPNPLLGEMYAPYNSNGPISLSPDSRDLKVSNGEKNFLKSMEQRLKEVTHANP